MRLLDISQSWLNNCQQFTTLDAHTEGEPLRIITSGYPALEGETILQKDNM